MKNLTIHSFIRIVFVFISTAFLLLTTLTANATCYRVTGTYTGTGQPPNNQILPGEGVADAWQGACPSCGNDLGLSSVVNITDASFQPLGSIIDSAVAPFALYGRRRSGRNWGYDSEHVFFRCASSDAVYEMYATNGLDSYGGAADGLTDGASIGLQGAYRTAVPDMLMRITNLATGQYFSHFWQERPLTGLDTDSRGYLLVKAKNLATINVELIRANSEGVIDRVSSAANNHASLNGMIAIKGPGLQYPSVGASSASSRGGSYDNWPGAISLFGSSTTIRRSRTCAVLNVTPTVQFAPITVQALNRGETRRIPFDLEFHCQTGTRSGTSADQTAIGFLPSKGSVSYAHSLGLLNSTLGLSHIVSDAYGASYSAKGVGIRIYRNGSPMMILGGQRLYGAGQQGGWYPVASPNQGWNKGPGDTDLYHEAFEAELERIAGVEVKPGQILANVQVLIRVQ